MKPNLAKSAHSESEPQSGETRDDIKAAPAGAGLPLAFLSQGSRHGLEIFCRSAAALMLLKDSQIDQGLLKSVPPHFNA